MQIDFRATINSLDGEPIKENNEPVTLGTLSIGALLNTLIDERGQPERLEAEQKVRQALLAQTIYKAEKTVTIKAEDIVLLKERIGRSYAPLAVMQAFALLDPGE